MAFSKVRPVIFGALFLAWLGYLLFLVLETTDTVISKPQFQIAQLVLIVKVRNDAGKPDPIVTVKEVLKGNDKEQQLAGEPLRLTDLLACKKEHGYVGAGDYVIPLLRHGGGWQIAPIPSPGYNRKDASHGTLELRDAGPSPECVLWRLLEYARQKPSEADDLLEPLMPQVATCYFGRAFFGEDYGPVVFDANFHWQTWIDVPRAPLPRRLPIGDALVLKKELEKCKAEVKVTMEEVRIYPLSPEVRRQVEALIAGK